MKSLLSGFFLASVLAVSASEFPWPVSGSGRVYFQSGASAVTLETVLGVQLLPASGSGWVLVPVGTYGAGCLGVVTSVDVLDGQTYYLAPAPVGPGAWWAVQDAPLNFLPTWSQGFGFGLLVFGFGWVLRLTNHIPEGV